MLFQTFQFVIFFAAVFAVYWNLPQHRWRLGWLLAASIFFYMSWNPWLISLILLSASVDYVVALRLERTSGAGMRRTLVALSILFNLSLLAFFKYANFFLDNSRQLAAWLGFSFEPPLVNVILPLGISFYTFETISYIVDVYRGRVTAVRSPLDYALYIMFFPHLVAGPIVRPHDFLPQLKSRKRFSWPRMQIGVQYFLLGLFKKVAIADTMATLADPVFKAPGDYSSFAILLGVVAYALQIYCDFSGYSDMAIGAAHMLGFKLPNNFNMPYFAANITEFWRRWHISLSSWLRDYLYVPLGGNRFGAWATYRNLLLTMLLGGLWHGAQWTFVCWGLFHGILLAVHRAWPWKDRWPLLRPLGIAFTFTLVCIGWVFFRAQTFGDAWTILQRLVIPSGGLDFSPALVVLACQLLMLVLIAHLVGTFVKVRMLWPRVPAPVLSAAMAVLLCLAMLMTREEGTSFIYFQF